jgi:L-fuculose-phosphate aldolase
MAETLGASKTELVELAHRQMRAAIPDNDWTVRQKLALTCRILFEAGHDSGLAGQITARAEQPGTYWTQQFGLGFDEITESNLLLVDEDLNVLAGEGSPRPKTGEGMANPANRFHSWIYRARPDVTCVIHTHPRHVSALSMLETPLVVSHMDFTPLYEDCAFLPAWPGIPVGNEEGEIISAALGDRRALLMAHHGQLVATGSVEDSCVLAVLIERAAELQLLASAAGQIRPLPAGLAREAHDWTSTPKRGQASFAYHARRALRAGHGDALS